MKKNSHRPTQTEIINLKKAKKQSEKKLNQALEAEGFDLRKRDSIPNCKCPYKSVEEEVAEREEAVSEQLRIMKSQLPILLKQLAKIKDPRNPKKCKHKMTILLIYGILTFVFQMSSRREANREITRPIFIRNLQIYFPEIDDLPHSDTLMRLLSNIEVETIECASIALVRGLIKNKKFRSYLIDKSYPIAVDGTQKFARDDIWSEECLERNVKKGKDGRKKQYYVYVLEACLSFHNGMTIPLMSEFLSYAEGDTEKNKQDCESRAFHRLADRLKKEFPRLPVIFLLDGLYPNGPIMEHCIRNSWQFMIVLKDDSLPTVWKEFEILRSLEKNNKKKMKWGRRRQEFEWVNEITYGYNNDKKHITLHVVVCEEAWDEVDCYGEVKGKTSRHAWISSKPLSCKNVHERCNLAARYRWGIESGILIEKRHGFQYEHCFSYNWNAMKGYHYLMKIGRIFLILAEYSECLTKKFKLLGKRGFVRFIRDTMKGSLLVYDMVINRLNKNFQLRLI